MATELKRIRGEFLEKQNQIYKIDLSIDGAAEGGQEDLEHVVSAEQGQAAGLLAAVRKFWSWIRTTFMRVCK